MSNVPEEPDIETAALIEKLNPAPERDPQAAANGRSKFLAEGREYAARAYADREQHRTQSKENSLDLVGVPVFLLLIAVIGVGALYLLTSGPIIGNTFSTINRSLNSVGGPPSTAYSPQGPAWPTPQPTAGAAPLQPQGGGPTDHMVVKNGEIRLLVKDTDRALDGVTQVVTDTQGYVISSRIWYQDYHGTNYKYATLTMGLPVDQFENALRRLRSLAVRVIDENASGQDVTEQYVDLQSQLTNLEATRDRIKSFLTQATTVDQALQINQQLAEIEAQIETIKGQMNYLSNRSAFSTITVDLEPQLPEIAPTPTPIATPTPVAGLGPWDPGQTTKQATDALVSVYRLIADFLIWLFVVVVPIVGPPALLIWLVMWLIRRRNRAGAKSQAA